MSDALSRSLSSPRRRNANGDVIGDHIVHMSPVLYVPRDISSLPTIQARVRQCLSKHLPSEVPRGETPVDVAEGGILDVYVADFDGEGDCELSVSTERLDLGRCASVCVDYIRLEEVCSATAMALPSSVVYLIRLRYTGCFRFDRPSCCGSSSWRVGGDVDNWYRAFQYVIVADCFQG